MYIEKLSIKDFRNYKDLSIEFNPFINLLIGRNAQGKTNLLEALILSALGKSPRTNKDRELIRWECSQSKITVFAKKSYGVDKVEIVLDKSINKRIAINGASALRIGELIGIVPSVFFSPDEMALIKDSPQERRRFLDIALSQISRNYFYLLNKYNRILSQRNRLIKNSSVSNEALDVWDTQLVESGSLIIKTRKGFISALNNTASKEHLFLTDSNEKLDLTYESIEGNTKEEIGENFLKQLRESRERDLRVGYTNVGTHKDDMGVFINCVDARKFASQGQQRTAALSLKLAEVELVKKEKGETPILLLDDVMGELDLNRQSKLLERIKGMQAMITCTHLDPSILGSLKNHKTFQITNGTASKK